MQFEANRKPFDSHPGGPEGGSSLFLGLAAMVVAYATIGSSNAMARPGDLDPTFGHNGLAFYDAATDGGCRTQASAIGILPDASIVVTGVVYSASAREDLFILKIGEGGAMLDGRVLRYGADSVAGRALATSSFGTFYIGANLANTGAVFAFHPDITLDTSFGQSGEVDVAAFGDVDHTTRINDLVYNESDGAPLYVTGTYDGAGSGQMLLARFNATTPVNAQSFGIASGDNVATALGVYSDANGVHAVLGGYGGSECIAASFHPTYDPAHGDWNFDFDPFYTSIVYGYSGLQACFTDALTVLPDHSQLAAGRVVNGDGSWSAYFQHLSPGGGQTAPSQIFNMSPWGDNSIRRIVVQPDGKWVMVGFTGVDQQNSPGVWVGRFLPSGAVDTSYATNGANLIDFDTQDLAYGKAFGAALDADGRVVITGLYGTGTSDDQGNDCTLAFVARFQGDDLIFRDGFDDARPE
jgi:hypothetical protein